MSASCLVHMHITHSTDTIVLAGVGVTVINVGLTCVSHEAWHAHTSEAIHQILGDVMYKCFD